MLVCNVSLRAPRAGITADVAEITAAVDALATGNIVFATLVDDPASVRDIVDAYSGEIMLEAASAAELADAGLVYGADVLEEATAVSAQDAPIPQTYVVAIVETVAAIDAPDAARPVSVPMLSASRAGLGSVIAAASTGKTQFISNIGTVT